MRGGLGEGWGGAGRDWSCQADCELPRVTHCVGASLQPLWHQESLLWERCCLPHRIPPRLPRTVPAAPRSGSQRVGIPPLLPSPSHCCSDLIPPLVGFLAAVTISLPFSHPASRSSPAQQIFHGGFAILQGMRRADKYPKCSWENGQETRATTKAEKTTGRKFAEVWKGCSCNRRKMHMFPEGSVMYFWGSPNKYVYTMQP